MLIAIIAGMAFFGAGIFTGVVHAAAALSLITALLVVRRDTASDAQVIGKNQRLETGVLLILAGLLLSLVPLPQCLDWTWGEVRATHYAQAREALERATALPGLVTADQIGRAFAFTYNRAGTLRAMALFCAMVGAFMLASRVNERSFRIVIWALATLATAIAILGYLGRHVWPQGFNLWWLFPVHGGPVPPIGGFMNRNHFGGYLALLMPLTIGLLLKAGGERRAGPAMSAIVLFAAVVFGVIMSHSRGSLMAAGAGFCVTLTFYGLVCGNRRALFFLIPAASAVLAATWFALPASLTDRFAAMLHPAADTSIMMRVNAWRDTLRVFLAHPLFGVGANALGMIYPQFRATSHGGLLRYNDNDYLQSLAEFGSLGAILGIVVLVLLWRRYRNNRANRPLPAGLEAGLVGCLAVAALHSLIDVPMRIPLYGITAAAFAGLLSGTCCGAGGDVDRHPGFLRSLIAPRRALPAICLLAVALSAPWMGQIRRLDYPIYVDTAPLPELARALRWSPTASRIWFNLGREACNAAGNMDDARYHFGVDCIVNAATLDPNNYRLWQQLGYIHLNAGQYAEARRAFMRAKELRPWLGMPAIPDTEDH